MDVRQQLERHLDGRRQELVELSHAVHADAEVGFAEHSSSARVAARGSATGDPTGSGRGHAASYRAGS